MIRSTCIIPACPRSFFMEKTGGPQLHVVRPDVAGRTLLLPIRFFSSAKDPTLYCMMPEVQDIPVLYNSDLIAANPEAEVIITDEMGIPLVNDSDNEHIFSSWYGRMDVVEKVDPELPPDHPYRWLCFDTGDGPVKKYEKAVKVARTVFQQHGRKIDSQVFDGVTWTRNVFGMETGTYSNHASLEAKREKMQLLPDFLNLADGTNPHTLGNCSQDPEILDLLKQLPRQYAEEIKQILEIMIKSGPRTVVELRQKLTG